MKRITRNVIVSAATAVGTLGAAAALGANGLFSFALDTKAPRSMFSPDRRAGDAAGAPLDDPESVAAAAWFEEAKQPVTIVSDDDLLLHAWLFDPDCADPKPHLFAVCCHGYTGKPAEMARWAHRYARMGFTVLVPAQRAHELSEGRYVGMGWLERNDLLDWVRLVVDSDPQARILLHGNSMGAATVMMTTGDPRLPRNVVAAVEDSGYASVTDQFTQVARSMFRMPRAVARLMVMLSSLVCRRRAGWRFEDASCTRALRHATIPMLFVHGGADSFVSPSCLQRNHDACASLDRQALLVPGAEHTMAVAVAPEVYWRKVERFVTRAFDL